MSNENFLMGFLISKTSFRRPPLVDVGSTPGDRRSILQDVTQCWDFRHWWDDIKLHCNEITLVGRIFSDANDRYLDRHGRRRQQPRVAQLFVHIWRDLYSSCSLSQTIGYSREISLRHLFFFRFIFGRFESRQFLLSFEKKCSDTW